MKETLLDQAKRIHRAHVIAGGLDGHSAMDQWSRCPQADCQAFRERVGGPALGGLARGYRVHGAPARDVLRQLAGLATAGEAAVRAARAQDGQALSLVALDGPAPEEPGPAEQEAANAAYAAARAAGLAAGEAIQAAWRAALVQVRAGVLEKPEPSQNT